MIIKEEFEKVFMNMKNRKATRLVEILAGLLNNLVEDITIYYMK